MLEILKIRNIAIIDFAEINFKQGLNILSGETGAGKSIIVEAISLLLGSRASSDLVRTGEDEAVVEGLFDLSDKIMGPKVKARLEDAGLPSDGGELLIRRAVHRAGKHRIHINGELATLSILQNVADGLIDLCSQHEHQSLARSAVQLELLDRYGKLADPASELVTGLAQFRALSRELEELRTSEAERARQADFLKFQVEELRSADLQAGEQESLHTEKQLLQSSESRAQAAESVRKCLDAGDSGDEGATQAIRLALQRLKTLNQLDPVATNSIREGLERALAETEEAELAVNRYQATIDLNAEKLEQVQERLSLIADLRRKYGGTFEEMIATLTRLETEYEALDQTGNRISELEAAIVKLQSALLAQAKKLSAARKKMADKLSGLVTGELNDLKMGEARFVVDVRTVDAISEWPASGPDVVQFLIQTNKGDVLRPLGKIASGGELSRLMLSIRRVIADRGGIGVYLFDEIDAGIGGQTAFQVGKKLKSVASHHQVICITHLPQVASFADHHLVVRKDSKSKRTLTEVAALSNKERQEELARMLGGPTLTRKSMENAAELLQLAR